MGNKDSSEGSFDPKFMEEHRKKMGQIQGQYQNHRIEAPGAFAAHRVENQTENMKGIKRQAYLLKPTINIQIMANKFTIHFQYHSSSMCRFEIFLGIKQVQRQSSENNNIVSWASFSEELPAEEKKQFEKVYEIDPAIGNKILSNGIILRVCTEVEKSEYCLTYMKSLKDWKVVVETFERNGQNFGIEDIYGGGGEGQDCIICFCEPSNTMVKPCNHLCLCEECSISVKNQTNNCPICRKQIISFVTLKKE